MKEEKNMILVASFEYVDLPMPTAIHSHGESASYLHPSLDQAHLPLVEFPIRIAFIIPPHLS